jgi:multimeric flavodoxin WrbA
MVEELIAAGYGIDEWVLRETRIQPCEGDFVCLVKTPGVCGHADAGREIAEQFVRSDLTVWLSPVTFGGYSAQLTKAVDRLGCPLIWPSLSKQHGQHHYKPRYDAYPRLLVLGVGEEHDAESERLLEALVARNAMTLYLPSHAVGVVAPGQSEAELRSAACRFLRTVGAD